MISVYSTGRASHSAAPVQSTHRAATRRRTGRLTSKFQNVTAPVNSPEEQLWVGWCASAASRETRAGAGGLGSAQDPSYPVWTRLTRLPVYPSYPSTRLPVLPVLPVLHPSCTRLAGITRPPVCPAYSAALLKSSPPTCGWVHMLGTTAGPSSSDAPFGPSLANLLT